MNETRTPESPLTKKLSRYELTHFGAANWRITDGQTTVLLDPYFSRIRYRGKAFGTTTTPAIEGDARPVYGINDVLTSDTQTIDKHVDRADFILLSHSHFNHCMDTPHIARKTGAKVIGSESSINVMRACGVPETQLYAVHGGEDYEFGVLSIKIIPSLHSPLSEKHYFDSDTIPRDIKAPLRLGEYAEGGTFAYLIRFGTHSILMFGSMNYIEREVTGLRPDIALIAAAKARLGIHDYTGRLVRALGCPPHIIATHWDVQSAPYGASQDAAFEQAQSFLREAKAVAPRARVVVPRHFETVVVELPDPGC